MLQTLTILTTYPFRNLVDLAVQEVIVHVEMLILEHALTDHLVGHLSLHIHHILQHLEIITSK